LSAKPYGIVAGIDMQSDITEIVSACKKMTKFRGFRNLLNFEPTVDAEVTSNRFVEEAVITNFKKLEAEDVSFELHLNPSQYEDAAKVLEACPKLRVIIDHCGSPFMEHLQGEAYWAGMKRFAALPNVHIKISFFGRINPAWDQFEYVIGKCKELIKIFTPQRSMFATNFPVDCMECFGSWTMTRLLTVFNSIAEDLSEEEKKWLFHDTALKVYRMPENCDKETGKANL